MKAPSRRLPGARLAVGTATLAVGLAVVCVGALCIGQYPYPPVRVAQALWHGVVGGAPADLPPEEWPPLRETVLAIRLPRVATGALVGFALASAGSALQGVLRNPLADPYIIGVSSGAGLGAALAVVIGIDAALGGSAVSACAFLGALVALGLVLGLARRHGRLRSESFLVAGVAVGGFCWSGITLLLALAGMELDRVLHWLLGSLSLRERYLPPLAIAVAGGWIVLLRHARALDLLALGDEAAHQLGVAVERTRLAVILAAALVTAASVAVSGMIGFVGLMVPQMVRRVVGPDQRVLLPLSALAGASFLVAADAAARAYGLLLLRVFGHSVSDLPVGVVTALLGGPVMFLLLRREVRG